MPDDEENLICFLGYKDLPRSPWYYRFGDPSCWKCLYFVVYVMCPMFVWNSLLVQPGVDESLMPLWKTAECQPSHAVKGSQCCYSWSSSLLDPSCGIHGNVPNYYSNVYSSSCGNSGKALTMDSVNRDNCEDDHGISAWPRNDFSEEFIISNSTFKCYTDCKTFSLTEKEEPKILTFMMAVGWGSLYVPPVLQTIQYAVTKDNFLGLYLHFAMVIYASTSHCACLVKDDHPAVYSGYVMLLILPVLMFCMACPDINDGFKDPGFSGITEILIMMYMLCCICLLCTSTTLEGVFRADFCMAQHIVLLGFTTMSILLWAYIRISTYIRNKNKYKNHNNEKLATIRRVEDRWLQIKEVIFPLIDERDMVWDIIWTYYYGMEKEFAMISKTSGPNEDFLYLKRDCKQLQDLELVSDYWAVNPFLSSGKCYTFAGIQAEMQYGESFEGNMIDLDVVANSIGNYDFHYGDFTKNHSKKTKLIAFDDKSEGGWGVDFFMNDSGSIIKVVKIYKGSQFEKKGVKSGWTINRVNGLKADEASGKSIKEILSAGAKCRIQFSWKKFKRGDRVMILNEDVSGIFVKYYGDDKCRIRLSDGTIKNFPEWRLVEAEVNLKEVVADIVGEDAKNKGHTGILVKGTESIENRKLIPSKVESIWKEKAVGKPPVNETEAREVLQLCLESDSISLAAFWTKLELGRLFKWIAKQAKQNSGINADKDLIFHCIDTNDNGVLEIEELCYALQALWLMCKSEVAFEQFLGDKPQQTHLKKDVFICPDERFRPGDRITIVNTKTYDGLNGIFVEYIEGDKKCRIQFPSLGGAIKRAPTKNVKKQNDL